MSTLIQRAAYPFGLTLTFLGILFKTVIMFTSIKESIAKYILS